MRILDIAYLSATSFSKRELKLTTESPYSLVVPKDMGAIDATRIAELNRIGVICVVNSLPTDPLEGIVSLDSVSRQIEKRRGIIVSSVSEELAKLLADPLLIDAKSRYGWFNAERPNLEWCERHKHLTVLPCQYA
jgi:hypothetical protein